MSSAHGDLFHFEMHMLILVPTLTPRAAKKRLVFHQFVLPSRISHLIAQFSRTHPTVPPNLRPLHHRSLCLRPQTQSNTAHALPPSLSHGKTGWLRVYSIVLRRPPLQSNCDLRDCLPPLVPTQTYRPTISTRGLSMLVSSRCDQQPMSSSR
jgi:hypothetical protein